jgi:hypothetical protein
MADLSVLAAEAPAAQRQGFGLEFGAAYSSTDTAVRRLTDNLQAAVDDTTSQTLSGSLVSTLDTFRRGIETLVRGANPGGKPNVATMATARSQMQQTLTSINTTVLKEMDGLLQNRLDDLDSDRRQALFLAVAAVLLVLLVVLLTGLPLLRPRRGDPLDGDDPDAAAGGATVAGHGSGVGNHDQLPQTSDEVHPNRRERSGALR